MSKVASARTGGVVAALLALLLGALALVVVSHASAGARVPVVQTAKNAKLHETILVNRKGMTLYSLSAERNGRFICANSQCLSFWTPLVVAKGVTPAGAVKLGTIKRPDGRIQVTFRGGPLYTFKLDRKRGDVKGEGFKDIGTWHAAALSASKPVSTNPSPSPYPYGGGGGGGY